ncbi:MAG: glycosyltransferase family 4 protein [Chloroflexi bacterium]|nr:glycosyltransferase family 4 protein [Chloroflexota bacterium]MCL5952337.1 glycosyltransferase family 4 protein [Chloroflexota bacterium]
MRIAWFGHVASARADGIVSYSHEMIRGLRQRGQNVLFFYHISRERGQVRDPQGIHIGSFDILNRAVISSPRARALIEEILAQERIDIAHISLSFSQLDFSLPEICHAMGVPVVATIHFPYGPPETFWGSAVRVLYRVYSGSLKHYDAVIVFSEDQRALLIKYGVSAERVRVIPNGVDIVTFSPGAADYKEQINASILISYMGRLDPEKNVPDLLNAFQRLNLPRDHKLVVVGSGMDLSRLRRKAAGDHRIILRGFVGDLRERIRILRAADIFVLPSSIEGLSLAMLEAMATGTAVVATNVGADAEALRGAGVVVDLDSLEGQLPLVLRMLVDYPEFRRDLATRARQRAVEEYSLETNIDRVVTLYRELAHCD